MRAENICGLNKISIDNLKYITSETHNGFLKRSILQENDILITIAGTLGRTGIVLKEFLDSLNSKGVSVNLDPANLVMVTGDDPVEAVYTLKDYIVHTHAKDGIKLLDKNPEIIYHIIEAELDSQVAFREVPLGEGSVDFPRYLAALDDIGYKGFLTIEREVGSDPAKDIAMAVNFLKKHY